MVWLEILLFEVSKIFLAPILLAIVLVFLYSFWLIGVFMMEYKARRSGFKVMANMNLETLQDYELVVLKRTELMRIISRTAPMLGLIATMIPMGPALVELGAGNMEGVGANLAIAFSAVIVALLSASIIYAVLTVRKRWLLDELKDIEKEFNR